MKQLELALVMPAYNEAANVQRVVKEWLGELNLLSVSWELHVYNDGSRDATGEILDRLARNDQHLVVHHQANRGHGPTLVAAYQDLGQRAAWLFQTDSDGEFTATDFAEFWRQRNDHDLLLGYRPQHDRPLARQGMSYAARSVVKWLFKADLRDVNIPYRLMRTKTLRPLFDVLPADMFAPNVVLSGIAAKRGLKIKQLLVTYHPRRTGSLSGNVIPLAKIALRTGRETIQFFKTNR